MKSVCLAIMLLAAATCITLPVVHAAGPDRVPLKKADPTDTSLYEEDEEDAEEEQAAPEEKTPEVLPKETILEVLQKWMDPITNCYESELKKDLKLKGKVLVRFYIPLNGRVSSASVVPDGTSLKNREVHQCILKEMSKISFPPRESGETMEINFPFRFQPKELL